jgi:hypothetical protein
LPGNQAKDDTSSPRHPPPTTSHFPFPTALTYPGKEDRSLFT